MQKKTLGDSGLELSVLGFGMGPIGWRTDSVTDDELSGIVGQLLSRGVTYFDTAPMYGYGNAELRLGRMLSGHTRSDFVVSTKVGRLLRPELTGNPSNPVIFDYSYDAAWVSIEQSLRRLHLERIDIVLIHDIDRRTHGETQPRRFREAVQGAYPALASMKEQGLVRAIGLGVNEWQVCRDFATEVPVDCFMLAGQHSLLNQDALREFLPWCEAHGISLMIAGAFNSGILAKGARPGARYDYELADDSVLTRVRDIERICAAHHVPLPAAALAFSARGPSIASVVVGASSLEQTVQMLEFARFKVPSEFWRDMVDQGLVPRAYTQQ